MAIKINSTKLFLTASVLLNLCLGIVYARQSGQINGLTDINALYLSSACVNPQAFRSTLEAFDVSTLPAKISEPERQKWINGQLSKCGQKR